MGPDTQSAPLGQMCPDCQCQLGPPGRLGEGAQEERRFPQLPKAKPPAAAGAPEWTGTGWASWERRVGAPPGLQHQSRVPDVLKCDE